jgi:hypothetical protein
MYRYPVRESNRRVYKGELLEGMQGIEYRYGQTNAVTGTVTANPRTANWLMFYSGAVRG